MARIVLGVGTSHTPMFALPPEKWARYAEIDRGIPELVFPPDGWSMSFKEAVESYVTDSIREKPRGIDVFRESAERCQRALDTLSGTLLDAAPDITLIISDDQDEWFFEDNMPAFFVYWGDVVPVIPIVARPGRDPEIGRLIAEGYGDRRIDVPVASEFGRFLVEYLIGHDFDVAQGTYINQTYGGSVARRYPTRRGELEHVRETRPRTQGLPHGFAFVIKRLFHNNPGTILPVIQNTCYPPNTPTPRRCYAFGRAIADAIESWEADVTVAIVASGGLSHFVVDEDIDRKLLQAITAKDSATLASLPRNRLYSATSESLNWVAASAAMEREPLNFELVDYVPIYRSEAGTGGGWAFGRWILPGGLSTPSTASSPSAFPRSAE